MSAAQKETLQTYLLGGYRALLGITMAAGVWLANEVWTDVKALPKQLDARVQQIEQKTAVLLDSRFTPADAAQLKADVRLDLQKQDLRLFTVEALQTSMRSSLERIEVRLGTK